MEEEFKKLMARVLRAIPGITIEDLEFMVNEKIKHNPYLNKVGALLLVAEELGVFDIREKVSQEILEEASYIKIGDLVPGLNNISVKGVIYAILGPFVGRDYRLLKMKIGDKTGKSEVYVWEDKIEEVKSLSLKIGDQIAIINAYTKEKIETAEVEIHLKKTSLVKKLPLDPSLPDPRQFYKSIGEIIERGEGLYDIRALVVSISSEKVVSTKHGEASVINLIVSDGRRELEMTAWREKAQLFRELKPGEEIYITDVKYDGDRLSLTSKSFIIFSETRDELLKIVEEKERRKILMRVVDIQSTPPSTLITLTDGEKIIHILYPVKIDLSKGDYVELSGVSEEEIYEGRLIKQKVRFIEKIDEPPLEIKIPDRNLSLMEIIKKREMIMRNIIVEGVLYTKTNLLVVETKYGPGEKILFWLKEGDTAIQGIAWRSKAQEIAQIPEGQRIRLKWITVKLNPFNEPEIHIESYSKIEKIT